MMRAIPSALPVASSATSSSPPRLCAEDERSGSGTIRRRDRLGDLIHEYRRAAA